MLKSSKSLGPSRILDGLLMKEAFQLRRRMLHFLGRRPSRLAKPLHIGDMVRFIIPIHFLGTATVVATILGVGSQFGLGIARSTVRTDALAGIIFVGIALAGSALLKRNK